MQITITLQGGESTAELENLARAVRALGGLDQSARVDIGMVTSVNGDFDPEKIKTDRNYLANEFGSAQTTGAGTGDTDPQNDKPVNMLVTDALTGEQTVQPLRVTAPVPLPPAPAVAEPSTNAPSAHAASSDVVDKAGLPWNERIHSSSRNFNADGTWRKRKNLEKAGVDVAAVEAELRAVTVPIIFGQQTDTSIPPPPIVAAIPAPPGTTMSFPDLVKLINASDYKTGFTQLFIDTAKGLGVENGLPGIAQASLKGDTTIALRFAQALGLA